MSGFIPVVAILLLFLVLVLVGRMTEFSAMLKGDADNYDERSRIHGILLLVFLVASAIGIVYCTNLLLPKILPPASSVHGVATDAMFNTTLAITGIVFIATQILLFWFAYKYHQKKGRKAVHFAHSNTLELVWTAIPAVVLTVLVVQGLTTWYEIFPSKDEMAEDKMVVEVTAKQFNWILRYPGEDQQFGKRVMSNEYISQQNELGIDFEDPATADDFMPTELVFIKDKPVLVKLGALDVLHSFYLPHFRVKMDCVPGVPTSFYFTPTRTTEEMREMLSNAEEYPEYQKLNDDGEPLWSAFNYELACTELCGKSHYGMRKEVIVVENDSAYQAWMSEQKRLKPTITEVPAPADSMASEEEGVTTVASL